MLKNADIPYSWYSLHWLSPDTLSSFTWENPGFVFAFLAIPIILLLRWWLYYRSTNKLPIALKAKDLHSSAASYLRYIPFLLMFLAIVFVIAALCRPQKTNVQVEQWTEGIDIMLAVDISESMQYEDFKPNRLEAAKNVATDFIAGRFQDRIGMVIFAGDAYSLSPLTTDYDLLNNYIKDVNFDMIEKSGTAIGSAIAVATNRMRESDTNSKVLILLSDGENTAGNIDPITAAKLAEAHDIKIYTIAIGRQGKVPVTVTVNDFFGKREVTKYIENNLDESTLRQIADIGQGEFYRATNNKALEEVFSRIDEYEKAEIKETKYKNTTDFYFIYLRWAIIFFLLWLLSRSTFISNVLHD